jgi:CubicO group peptidase (beta-lactamase class C family)
VCGGGGGGIYSTLADLARLWSALHAGRIVPPALVSEALRSQHSVPGQRPYGLGFWLTSAPPGAYLEGSDPGISFRSRFEPGKQLLYSVLSNTTRGAWPLVRELDAMLEAWQEAAG